MLLQFTVKLKQETYLCRCNGVVNAESLKIIRTQAIISNYKQFAVKSFGKQFFAVKSFGKQFFRCLPVDVSSS